MTTLVFGAAVCLLVLALSPVVVLAGEPASRSLRRHAAARRHRNAMSSFVGARRRNPAELLALTLTTNPLFIALTAPARWIRSQLLRPLKLTLLRLFSRRRRASAFSREGLWPDDPPFLSGVREPRRPKPNPPADAVALREPGER